MRTFLKALGLALAVTALLVLLAPPPVHAATYFLRSGGSNSNAGTSNTDGGAWQTLSKANATMVAGDVLQVVSITAADTLGADTSHVIRPTSNGSAGSRITYIGNPASPTTIGLSGITLNKSYISVKGFRSRLDIRFDYVDEAHKPVGDSVSYCHSQTVTFALAKSCVFFHNTVRNTTGNRTFVMLSNNLLVGPPYNSVSCSNCGVGVLGGDDDNVIRANVINGGTISNPGQDRFFYMRYCHRDTVDSNQLTATFSGTNGDCAGRYIYNSQNNLIIDNKWAFEATIACPGGTDWVGYANRDSFSTNVFQRDTVFAGVSSGYNIGGRLVNSGNANWSTTNHADQWVSCFYKTTGANWFQTSVTGMTLLNSIFWSKNARGLEVQTGSALSIHHCTIAGNNANNFGTSLAFVDPVGFSASSVTGCIFYTNNQTSIGYERGIAYFNTYAASNLVNSNLYYAPACVTVNQGYLHAVAAPGSSGNKIGATSSWCTADTHDCLTKWGSPRFTDSTFATLNVAPLSTSYAVDAVAFAQAEGYAGALAPADVTAPDSCVFQIADVTALSSTREQVLLQWVNSGDDGMVGQATTVEIAVSTNADAQPNASNFDSFKVWSGTPDEPGSTQSLPWVLTLPAHVVFDFYFTLRIKDEAGNTTYSSITY